MFNNKYKEVIKYSAVFQKQKEEIDTLIRISNFLNTLFDEKELELIEKEFSIIYHGSRSTFLYKEVFEDIKNRSFPITDKNKDWSLNDIQSKNESSVFLLYKSQEEEIENLFKRMLKLIKIAEERKPDLSFPYLSYFNYLTQYEDCQRVYFHDIHVGSNEPEQRLFKIKEGDRKEYLRLFEKIKEDVKN